MILSNIHKTILTILILSGCTGMMMHGTGHDHNTGESQTKVLYDNLEIDDHDNPAIVFDEDGHLLVFFCTHMQGGKPLYMVRSTEPENIEQWTDVKELHLNAAVNGKRNMHHCYSHPIRLTGENNRLFLFWRENSCCSNLRMC